MKYLIFIAAILFSQWSISQISIPVELNQKLNDKEKFHDIKNTVLDHYNVELSKLSVRDSLQKKSIMRQLKMWNRQFWLSEYYTDNNGMVQDKTKVDVAGIIEVDRNFRKNEDGSRTQLYPWTNQGPYNSDKGIGRFDKIAFHPTDPNIVFAGSPHGGLFKTINGGDSWEPISAFIPSLGISGIVVHPTNPQIIYVLTGDGNSSDGGFVNSYLYRSSSQGVLKSIDGGNSWIKTGVFPGSENLLYRGTDLIINPDDPEILIASTTIGIFRTTTGGQSWVNSFAQSTFDIAFKPGDPNIVYATVGNDFLRSIDGGINFQFTTGNLFAGANRISIGTTQANSNKVLLFCGPGYAGMGTASFKGLYVSTTSGSDNSFSLITNTPNLFYNFIGLLESNSGTGQAAYNNCIAISPTNENEIYVGGLCVWKSTDGGANWTQVSAYWPWTSPYMHPDIHDLAYNPINNNLFCANDGGVYKYNNGVWDAKFNGLTSSQFYHFERENGNHKIWGGLQDNGHLEQASGGNYIEVSGGDGYDQMTDHNYLVSNGTGNTKYFTVNKSIYKNCYTTTSCVISVPNNDSFFGNLGMSPVEKDRIYVGYQQAVYRSEDAGSNWSAIGTASGNWCLAVGRNVGTVYAAGDGITGQRLFRLYYPSSTWSNITPPAPYDNQLKITDIEIDPLDINHVYISVGGTNANAKVFMTSNAGNTWTNLSFNLPNVPIFCIKKDINHGLYVGTSIGVFYKPPGYLHWQHFSNNLPPVPVTEIELWPEPYPVNGNPPSNPPPTPEIWISTFGRGIWFTQQYSPACLPVVNLDNSYHAGPYLWEASDQLNSAKNNGGGIMTDVKYSAGNKIILQDGFRANHGTKFKTYIQPCGLQTDLQDNDGSSTRSNPNVNTSTFTPKIETPTPIKKD